MVPAINSRCGDGHWKPVDLVKEHQSPVQMMALHLLSRFEIVSSPHDGMNLVAKEYCASRYDDDGVLILSRFTGATRELEDALLVNPFASVELASAIDHALNMPPEERVKRMRRMREQIAYNDVFRWAGKILSALLRFDFPEGT